LRPPLVLSVFAPREGNGSFALCQRKALCASGSSFWFQRERGQPVQQGKRKKWGLWFVSIFLKGEKTSPAERRRNQKIKKPPLPRVFSGF